MTIIESIRDVVGSKQVLLGDDVRQKNMEWGEQTPCQALAWMRPGNTAELAAVLKLCHEHHQPVNITAGLTNLVRGTVSREDEIVVSTERLNTIEEVNGIEMTMTAGAGVVLQQAHDVAAEADLFFPWDIGSRGSCMLGGNLATNAGGTKVIKYGMARNSVLGIEVVLADGTILSSLNGYMKNNSGVDLKQLFIGSEGIYGVISKVVIALQPQSSHRQLAFCGLNSYTEVLALFAAAKKAVGASLSGFEVMWQEFYQGSLQAHTQRAPLAVDYGFYVLLETMDQRQDMAPQLETLVSEWIAAGLATDAVLAQSEKDVADLWAIRHNVDFIYQLLDTVLSFDISLRIADIHNYAESVRAELAVIAPKAQCIAFGHLGDNNLHLTIAMEDDAAALESVRDMVYRQALPFAGAISGEHGIGLEKKPYLAFSRTAEEIAVMKQLKQSFDPHNILNRGRMFDL